MNKVFRPITYKEFFKLPVGQKILVSCGGRLCESEIIRGAFYNYDADEPDYEIETNNGFCDWESVYVYE